METNNVEGRSERVWYLACHCLFESDQQRISAGNAVTPISVRLTVIHDELSIGCREVLEFR